tara:strand:- start:2232 stop:3329 length:1098 start_codon:yes stop_codon:yes gene_type:complete
MKKIILFTILFSISFSQDLSLKVSGEMLYEYAAYEVVVISDEEYGYSGSGVIVDSRGYILTNYHVIEELENIQCYLYDNNEDKHLFSDLKSDDFYNVEIISQDPIRDLALLKLINPPDNLNGIDFAPSSSTKVGGQVFAIGHPGDQWDSFLWYFTEGSVNKIGMEKMYDEQGWIDWLFNIETPVIDEVKHIYTQTPINGGNSGGLLMDTYGNLVGINSWGYEGFMNISGAVHIDEINLFIKESGVELDNYAIQDVYDESGEKVVGYRYLVLSYGNVVSIEQMNSTLIPDTIEYYLIDLNLDNIGEISAFDVRNDGLYSYWQINIDSDEYIDWEGEYEDAPEDYYDIINQGLEIFDAWSEEINRFE